MGVSGKVCPGDNLSFECTNHGGTATVWRGSIFDHCADMGTSNEITLLHDHSSFTQTERTCNNGIIVVQGVQAKNNSFTSQLNITISFDMVGKSINCTHDDESEVSVGYYTISFPTAG